MNKNAKKIFISICLVADMAMLNGIDTNRVAPRLFCDICDEFDLHDTEDCPTQAMPDPDEIDPVYNLQEHYVYLFCY